MLFSNQIALEILLIVVCQVQMDCCKMKASSFHQDIGTCPARLYCLWLHTRLDVEEIKFLPVFAWGELSTHAQNLCDLIDTQWKPVLQDKLVLCLIREGKCRCGIKSLNESTDTR